MASTISAGTTSGTAIAIAGDTSGALALQTNNGTTAVTVTTAQNVGIGTTSPSTKLSIVAATDQGLSVSDGTYTGTFNPTSLGGVSLGAGGAYPLIFYVNSGERMRIGSNGSVAIGTTDTTTGAPKVAISGGTQTYNLLTLTDTDTNYSTSNRYTAFYNSSGSFAGSIQHTGATAVTYATSSDARLKENIVDAPNALDKVMDIKVRSYDWKEDSSHVEYGLVAQEINEVYGEPVGVGGEDVKDDPWNIEYGRLTPILLKAIQELNAKVDAQALEIQALKGVA